MVFHDWGDRITGSCPQSLTHTFRSQIAYLTLCPHLPIALILNITLSRACIDDAIPDDFRSPDMKRLKNRELEQSSDSPPTIGLPESRIVALRHHPAVWVVPAGLLVFALVPLPYGFYILLRLIVCVVSVWLAYVQWKHDDAISGWVVVLVIIALVYNPIIVVHLTREVWTIINLVTSLVLIGHLRFLRRLTES